MGDGRDSGDTESLNRFYPHHPETVLDLFNALAIPIPNLNTNNAPGDADDVLLNSDDSTLSDPDYLLTERGRPSF